MEAWTQIIERGRHLRFPMRRKHTNFAAHQQGHNRLRLMILLLRLPSRAVMTCTFLATPTSTAIFSSVPRIIAGSNQCLRVSTETRFPAACSSSCWRGISQLTVIDTHCPPKGVKKVLYSYDPSLLDLAFHQEPDSNLKICLRMSPASVSDADSQGFYRHDPFQLTEIHAVFTFQHATAAIVDPPLQYTSKDCGRRLWNVPPTLLLHIVESHQGGSSVHSVLAYPVQYISSRTVLYI